MLTDAQIERYSRQILLPEVGGRGQERLLAARAVLVGDGPAATMAARLLGRAGVTVESVAAPECPADVGIALVDEGQLASLAPSFARRPCVVGRLSGADILVATLVGRPCPACFQAPPRRRDARETDTGLPAIARLALGALVASEALRVLLAPPATGRMTTLDLASGETGVTDPGPTDGCAACGGHA